MRSLGQQIVVVGTTELSRAAHLRSDSEQGQRNRLDPDPEAVPFVNLTQPRITMKRF